MPNELLLLTGASSDIGLALMRAQLTKNPELHVIAHSFRGTGRIADLAAEFAGRVTLLQADFSDPASVAGFGEAVAAIGTPTAIVHLPAAKLVYERFTKAKWAALETDMTVQVRSAFDLLQRFLPKMAKLERARVVFVLSSVVHGIPPKFMAPYVVAKYAQLGLMRALAAEYAATPVRINAISPSMVDTQFLTELGAVAVEMAAAGNPLKRNATPADLLGALDLFLSPASDYIQGIDLPIAAGTAI